ncbi:DUF7352 domain-containing protein [Gracilimonas tropica]|uniref:DUF7352 domain-containing protein n=1 Tax=Gracilimonas tropica TaxID=454600 RepID=UPI0003619594|nr:hypothetical protein [Gracilimonas tropica]
MKVIYKYKVQPSVMIREGAEILKIAYQNGELYLWAMVDSEADEEERNFCIVGTGNKLSSKAKNGTYLETVFQQGYVWHIFEYNCKQETSC